MCGIAGVLNYTEDPEKLISAMIAAIQYRGPDEAGIFVDPSIALGHCRLSIVGLDDGSQPISNEDGTLWVVYNGEVFNYPELKADLQKKGHLFATHTDTEVLVHLYEEYGKEFLSLLNGQFAFAIWDTVRKELFLARDRVGIRPLFYYQSAQKLIFASEIKAIFTDPSVPREIDPQALQQIFTYWTTLTPRTTFKNIFELPPGHFQIVKNGKIIEQSPFWSIPCYSDENCFSGTLDEAVEETRTLLNDAIRIRLRADVPVGAYLSGGLDSSIITSLISRNFNNKLRTFSIGFQEADFDETPYQRSLVDYFGTDHTELLISNQDIKDNLPRVIWHSEKPLLRTAPVPMFLLAKLVRDNNFKVVLTGEGADEVFGGYDIFKEAKIRHFWNKFPESTSRPRLLEKLHPYIFKDPARSRMILQKFYGVSNADLNDPCFSHKIRWDNTRKNMMFFSDDVMSELSGYSPEGELQKRFPAHFSSRDALAKAQFLEMDIFMSNYLLSSQGDRVAMGNSVELRVPFLDYRVLDFAMKLPSKWKIRGLNEKYILKKAFADIMPEQIINRQKQPYRAPIRELFFSGKSDYTEELLSRNYLKKTGYFNTVKTCNLIDKYNKTDRVIASETQNMAIIGVLTTQILHHQFVENFSRQPSNPISLTKRIFK